MTAIGWSESYFGQLRALCGDRTLLLTASRAVVRDAAGRVLLIRRSDNGVWSLPAGAMELGESIEQCAVREVWEETGLRAAAVTPFALYTGPDYTWTNMFGDTYQHFVVMFRVDEWSGEVARQTEETIDAGFFDCADAACLPRPLSGTVAESLNDLASFEATGRFVVK